MTFTRYGTVLTVLALAGCGASPETSAAPAASATASSSASGSPTPSAAPTSASAAPAATKGPLKFGTLQTVIAGTTEATVTAFAYRQPTAKSAPKPDTPNSEWASVDVQVCVKAASGETPYVNNTSWLLIYADGTNAEASNTGYNQFDAPGYPMGDRDLPAGRCVRGWITFVAPAGKRATMVEYQRGDGSVYDWAAF